ncbi:MAG: hypothetical protein K0Q52_1903 [Microbacterium sp.]|nr:hypothetical protein [Microbacterium sp.]
MLRPEWHVIRGHLVYGVRRLEQSAAGELAPDQLDVEPPRVVGERLYAGPNRASSRPVTT